MNQLKSVGRYISCIHRNFHKHMQEELQRYDIGSGQFHFLMMLYREDGVNQETLAERLNLDKATSARAIKKLEEKGFVTRLRNNNDKRNYTILLTEKAKKLKPKIKKILKKWTEQLLTDISKEDEKRLYFILEKMAQNAENKIN
jgi:DNA-binding MarR family transcriptional regulator